MAKQEFILSIIVGLSLFLTDFIFNWLTPISKPIPVIFIIAIIIGLVAGTHGGAMAATMITWIGGILIGILIAPIVFGVTLNPDQSILGLFLIVFFYSVRGFYTLIFEGDLIELFVVGLLSLVVMLIITPVLYLFSFAFVPIGVVIGKFIRNRVSGRSEKPKPMVQETPMIQSTPVEEEPVDVEESLETEKEFSDNADY